MKKNLLFLLLFFYGVMPVYASTILADGNEFNGIDLELTMNSPDVNPAIYTSTMANVVVTNTGDEAATNLIISVPIPDGFVLTGSNPYSLTAGDYSSYFGKWEINNLPSDGSVTLTLNLYVLTENQVILYGEIMALDGSDVDSTPDNGTPPVPSEDDEAVLNFNEVSIPELPDLTIDQLVVPNSIQLGVVTDIEYRLRNIGTADAVGPFTAYFYYSTDDQLNFGDPQVGQKIYDDIPAGNTSVEVDNIILLNSQGITVGNGYIFVKIDNDNIVAESNENNNETGSTQFSVTSIINNDDIDLELSLNQPVADPVQYSAYSVQLAVSNTGNSTATDVTVNVPRPDGVVYSGGNPFTLNAGDFSSYSDIYSISSIAPGATAQLTLNYFLLDPEAPNVYAQVTQATETDSDSTPNNGTPPTPNEDDEASLQTVISPPEFPDLVISEVDIPSTIFKGIPTSFTYRLENLGIISVEEPFVVSYFYSSDDQLSAEDISFGSRSYQDLAVGEFDDVFYGFTFLSISSTIPIGSGFIIIKADNNDSILESNEDNNIIATAVEIGDLSVSPCATNLGSGNLNCIIDTPNGGKELFYTLPDDGIGSLEGIVNEIDDMGRLLRSEPIGEIPREILYSIDGDLLRIAQIGYPSYSLPIPTSITTTYNFLIAATAFNNGFIFFAEMEGDLVAILTDSGLNPITENLIPPISNFFSSPEQVKAVQIGPDQVAILVTENVGLAGRVLGLTVLNGSLEVLSGKSIDSGSFVNGDLTETYCGNFKLSTSNYIGSAFGTSTASSTVFGDFINGEFIEKDRSFTLNSTITGVSSFSQINTLQTEDGGELVASRSSASNLLLIEKTLNGAVVFSKTIELTGGLLQLMEISGAIYLVVNDGAGIEGSQILRYYELDCLEDVSSPTEGVDLELTAELSEVSPDIYSNYSVVYTLVNNGTETATGIEVSFVLPAGTVYKGSNPYAVSRGSMSPYNNLYSLDELPAGETAVIELNYFSLTNAELAHYAEVVACNEEDVDSTPDNGTPITVNEDDETAVSTQPSASTNSSEVSNETSESDRLEILKLYPNPIMDANIRMALNAPTAMEQTFLIYNELGIEVLSKSINLEVGFNEIMLPTNNFSGGLYRILLPGNHARFGTASFMVIK